MNLTRCDCTTAVVDVLQAVGTFNSKFKQVVNMELAIKTFVVRRWSGYFQCQSSCNRDAVELKKKPSISDAVVRHPRYRTGCHELAQTPGRSCFMIVYHDDLHLGSKKPTHKQWELYWSSLLCQKHLCVATRNLQSVDQHQHETSQSKFKSKVYVAKRVATLFSFVK